MRRGPNVRRELNTEHEYTQLEYTQLEYTRE